MALAIAGERSGVGKTTITLALLTCLVRWGKTVQSFKVGPDYIDPMFHTEVTGRPCRNLDPVLTSEEYVKSCFAHHAQKVDYALVEGVMGLFDGVAYSNFKSEKHADYASTAHIARLLDIPILLVIDCGRLSGSVAAIAHGYRTFDPTVKIAGVVLNRVGSDRHQILLENALEPIQIPILGIFRRHESITIPDRHLGLIPAAELNQLKQICDRLAELGRTCFDWEKLFPLLKVNGRNNLSRQIHLNSSLLNRNQEKPSKQKNSNIKIAIARDRAFNFYYQDNLDQLEQLGAELIPWSPLNDSNLPQEIQGLYLGGGFPEIFASHLAENQSIHKAVRRAIQARIPTYAECGGLMYLCQQIIDFASQSWPMVGLLPTSSIMSQHLTLGYRQAKTLQHSTILRQGETIWGHEFHRSQLTSLPAKPLFSIIQGFNPSHPSEGWKIHQLHASYIHLHWGVHPQIPQRFIQNCLQSKPLTL